MPRAINLIVIHCSASPNGKQLAKNGQTAAATIDVWHSTRGFHRQPAAVAAFNPTLKSIGYHFVLDTDGSKSTGRGLDEIGAHVSGFNANSIGVCMVGTDQFTLLQWQALTSLIKALAAKYPSARIVGHRDLSPDKNHDGIIEPNEWLKTCPGFNVAEWLKGGMKPLSGKILGGV